MAYESWTLEAYVGGSWVDYSARVNTDAAQLVIQRGRSAEREDDPAGILAALVENQDHELSVGNAGSSIVADWGQGTPIRVRETADGDDYDLFTGRALIQDIDDWAKTGVAQGARLSATDQLGWLDQAPELRGSLTEYIGSQADHLVEWWPLADGPAERRCYSALTGRILQAGRASTEDATRLGIATAVDDLLGFQGAAGPPGDEVTYLDLSPVDGGGFGYTHWGQLTCVFDAGDSIEVGASDLLAVSVWVNVDETGFDFITRMVVWALAGSTDQWSLTIDPPPAGALAAIGTASLPEPTSESPGSGQAAKAGSWQLVTLTYNASTGAGQLWVGITEQYTASGTGGARSFDLGVVVGERYAGALAHLQIRVGPVASSPWTHADHVAQHLHGMAGADRQPVAERLEMIAGWAGLDPSEVDFHASAATPCQPVAVAGLKPAAALRATIDAEGGGRLFCGGNGWVRSVGRAERYQQAVKLQIPFAWLETGLRHREDVRATVAEATIAGSSPVRRADTAVNIAKYGYNLVSARLPSAVDDDAPNWALWNLDAYGQQRVRCPRISISLLHLTEAQRAGLLGLELGERIEITSPPGGWPPGLAHLIVEGIRHEITVHRGRRLILNTSPLLGGETGEAPYCPLVGDLVSASAVVAY